MTGYRLSDDQHRRRSRYPNRDRRTFNSTDPALEIATYPELITLTQTLVHRYGPGLLRHDSLQHHPDIDQRLRDFRDQLGLHPRRHTLDEMAQLQ